MEQGAVPTQQAKSWFEVPAAQDRALRLPGEAFNNRSGHALAQGFRDRAERGPIAGTCAGRLVSPTVHSITAESIEAQFSDQCQQIGPPLNEIKSAGVGLATHIHIRIVRA